MIQNSVTMQKIKLWKKTLFNTLVSKDASAEAEIFSTTGLINNSSYDTDNQNSRKKDWSGNKTTDYDRKTTEIENEEIPDTSALITNATLNRKKLNDHLKSYTKQIRQMMYVSLSIK